MKLTNPSCSDDRAGSPVLRGWAGPTPVTNVLLIVEALAGGGGRHVKDLAISLAADGFEVTVACGKDRASSALLSSLMHTDSQRVHVASLPHLVRRLSVSKDIQALLDLTKLIHKTKPDIVHCHSSKAGILGRAAAKLCGIETVFYTPHAYAFQSPEFGKIKKHMFILLERFFSRFATTKTFNVSESERKQALACGLDRPEKFIVVPNGISDAIPLSADAAKSRMGFRRNDIVVGTVARLSVQKNPIEFCRVAQLMLSRMPDLQFVYVGDGPLADDVKQYVLTHQLSGHCHLLGYRSDAERLMAGFDLFLMTSLYEGMPYSLIESLRAGIPIVASNVMGVKDIVTSRQIGLLYQPGNVEAAADQLTYALNVAWDKGLIREEYERRYTLTAMVARIEQEYRKDLKR